MNILIVCNGNVENFNFKIHQAFIYDQVEAIKKRFKEIKFDYFFIRGRGVWGYLSNIRLINRKIKSEKYDLIHAHYALSGLLANIQRRVPVVTTYHGSDINLSLIRIFSFFTAILSKRNIYVSNNLYKKSLIHLTKKDYVIPCGVDFGVFYPLPKEEAKVKMGLKKEKRYILFSSSFDNPVKNAKLAFEAVQLLNIPEVEILELKGYSRKEVMLLLNAVDVALMTSFSEGSPQFIKEAMACNRPIVSTNVGDVKNILKKTKGCYIAKYDASNLASKIKSALTIGQSNGRDNIKHLDNNIISKKIINIYLTLIDGVR